MKPWEKDASRQDFNEYYTLYEEADLVLRPLIDRLNDKHIHCPCDSEESNIVKWLKDNTTATITYSGLPDIDMNSDEAHDLMLKADIVITNPPYRSYLWHPFFVWLNDIYADKYHKDYLIWGPLPICGCSIKIGKAKYIYSVESSRSLSRPYLTTNGTIQNASTMWYTSFYTKPLTLVYKPSKKEQEYYKEIPVYNRSENVPPDLRDWMYVPMTYIRYIYLKDYEIDFDDMNVPGKFVRLKMRKIV